VNALSTHVGVACDIDEHCITCGDTSVPMVVLQVSEEHRTAVCRLESGVETATVDTWLIDDVRAGERLMVHAGTALERIDQIDEVTV
jgi:hydrogenase maturation factor